MPGYEYGCRDCRKRVMIYQSYEDYGRAHVSCPECGSENLKALMSVALNAAVRISNA